MQDPKNLLHSWHNHQDPKEQKWIFHVLNPDGHKFHSMSELNKHLDSNPDLKCDRNVTHLKSLTRLGFHKVDYWTTTNCCINVVWKWRFEIGSLWWFVECVFTILFPCTVSGMFDIAALKMFRYFWTGICIQCLSVILYSWIWTRKGRLAFQSYLLEEKGL